MTDVEAQDLEPAATPSKGKVTLRVAYPLDCTEFTAEDEQGGTMVFDRVGTEVPRKVVKTLTELAAKSGVMLTETE